MPTKLLALLAFLLCFQAASAQNDVVNDDEKSSFNLNKPEREQWLKNTGAGLFIHFSVDAQLGVVISHSLVGASDDYVERFFTELPKTFNPDKFNPREIAELAKLAGMKYIVFTTKHHSGFCMWDTKTTDFNITKTPYKKDLLKEFVDATRAAGLDVGFYFSPEDFYFLHANHLPITRDNVKLDAAMTQKYNDYNRRQCEELMTNYGKIDVFFIDGEPKEVVKQTSPGCRPSLSARLGSTSPPMSGISRAPSSSTSSLRPARKAARCCSTWAPSPMARCPSPRRTACAKWWPGTSSTTSASTASAAG
jgi:alpha-L-fucosidase